MTQEVPSVGHCGREGGVVSPDSHERQPRCFRRYCEWPSPPGNEEEDDSGGRTQRPQRLAPPRQGGAPRSHQRPSHLRGSALLRPLNFPSVAQHSPWAWPSTQPSEAPRAESLLDTSHTTTAFLAGPSHATPSTPAASTANTGSGQVRVPHRGRSDRENPKRGRRHHQGQQ